jgi:hypothetical protein
MTRVKADEELGRHCFIYSQLPRSLQDMKASDKMVVRGQTDAGVCKG